MFNPSASSTYSSAASAMRTHALPPCCRISGRISSASAAMAITTNLFWRLMKFIMGVAPSGPVRHALTQQARRPQRQHDDEDDEGEDVGVVGAEHAARHHADIARTDRLDESEQDAPDDRAGQVADAAEHRRR